jgi:uncharacterized protein (TIGR03083 family)
MNDDELWAAIDAQRLRTTDLLEELTPEEWDQPSLCERWTVRDVAGHLTLQQMTLGSALLLALRHPGGVNHLLDASSRERAKLPTDRLIAEIRGMVGSRRHVIGMTPLETLIDNVIHGQDIAVPTGRVLEVPPVVAATAASRVWDDQFSSKGRRKAKVFRKLPYEGHRLSATDIDWSVGDGPEIRGPVLALLLLLTGRPAVIPQLDGEGATTLATRLGARDRRN